MFLNRSVKFHCFVIISLRLNKHESTSPNNGLCLILLKFAEWFLEEDL